MRTKEFIIDVGGFLLGLGLGQSHIVCGLLGASFIFLNIYLKYFNNKK